MCNFKQVASLESSMETMKSNVVGLGNYINSINSDLGSMLTSFDGYANKINNDIAYVKSNVSELNDDINDMNLKTEDLRIKMDTMDYSTTTLKGQEISKRNCGVLKEYFPNLLVITFWGQIFVFQVRDLKFWLFAYFLILLSCAKFQ